MLALQTSKCIIQPMTTIKFSTPVQKSICAILFGLTVFLSGCQPAGTAESQTPTLEGLLTPYQTATPTQAPAPETLTTPASPTAIPSPTPTPVIYTVAAGDNLSSIAARHGVLLSDLIGANPGIDPNFLTIGMTLTIPTAEGNTGAIPSPTPIPLEVSTPLCYPRGDGSQWCLASVQNKMDFAVENISAEFLALTSQGHPLSRMAYAPTSLLPAGASSLLAAYFPAGIDLATTPQVHLRSVLPVSGATERYLTPTLTTLKIDYSPDKTSARITGQVTLPEDSPPAKFAQILAIAFDSQERPIGFRLWENQEVLSPGEPQTFTLNLYSLAPPIFRIDFLVEARP